MALSKAFNKKVVVAMARGTVVLDENLLDLEPLLKDLNIRVIVPPAKMPDAKIKAQFLANRILITNNSKDFVNDASSFDFGIIATEFLSSKDKFKVVEKISKALIHFNLWSLRHGFIVKLQDSGPGVFKVLVD